MINLFLIIITEIDFALQITFFQNNYDRKYLRPIYSKVRSFHLQIENNNFIKKHLHHHKNQQSKFLSFYILNYRIFIFLLYQFCFPKFNNQIIDFISLLFYCLVVIYK